MDKKAITLFFFIFSSSVNAAPSLMASGAGTTSCGDYIEFSTNKSASGLYQSWAQGFLSGLNIAKIKEVGENAKLIGIPNESTIRTYLNEYCKNNPLERPMNGALRLFVEIENR